jgi:hypothetical protein
MSAGQRNAGEINSLLRAIATQEELEAEVPRVSGTATHPAFYSSLNVLYALAAAGYKKVPVLATNAVAPWLKSELQALEKQAEWDLEYGES